VHELAGTRLASCEKARDKRTMSGHDAHGSHGTAVSQELDIHAHEATSSDDFPADEPRSPGWLPLLGGALFLAAIFAFVALQSDPAQPAAAEAAPAEPVAAPARVPSMAPARRPAPPILPGVAFPANHPQIPHGADN
jgi:hypothetical protein